WELTPYFFYVVAVGCISIRKWKENETRVRMRGQCDQQPRIPAVHGKHPNSLSESLLRVFHGRIVGQVISGMAIPQKMRVEADDQRARRRATCGSAARTDCN